MLPDGTMVIATRPEMFEGPIRVQTSNLHDQKDADEGDDSDEEVLVPAFNLAFNMQPVVVKSRRKWKLNLIPMGEGRALLTVTTISLFSGDSSPSSSSSSSSSSPSSSPTKSSRSKCANCVMILELGDDNAGTLEAPWSKFSRIRPVAPNRYLEYGIDDSWIVVGIASWPETHLDVRDQCSFL